MMGPLDAVYEKFKHLDFCLSDPEWCTSGEGAAIYAIAGELWRAVKEARNQPAGTQQPESKMEVPDGYHSSVYEFRRPGRLMFQEESKPGQDAHEIQTIGWVDFGEKLYKDPYITHMCNVAAAQATAAENKRMIGAMGQLKDSCECISLKEYASDFDRGFHQAMTLVRGWIDRKIESLRAQPEPKERDPE